ncbi:putative nuclease HARBI1 [Diadema setosum]|uniref:putative nuclease HARBI1 n=1 Tax=Diadema setosum TaxID=31175 RepID=UPI003B3A20AD
MELNEWRGAGPRGIPKSEQLICTFLDHIAGGGYYRQVGRAGGMATSTAFLHTRQACNFVFETASQYISLPRETEYEELSTRLTLPDGQVKRVVLYIDGYIARIQRPDHAGDAYLCGRHGKSCDSLNTQYIIDKHGIVRQVISGLPGSTHDKTATEWSLSFMNFLDRLPEDIVVLGDPAYRGLHRAVIHTAVGHDLGDAELRFNTDATKLRQVVERTIGATQRRWRMSQLKENRLAAKGGIVFPAKCLVAMAVLHNRFTNYV